MPLNDSQMSRFLELGNKGGMNDQEAMEYSNLYATLHAPRQDYDGMKEAFMGGLLGDKKKAEGFGEKAAQFAGEIAPATTGSIVGIPGGPGGMALGAAAFESLRQAAKQVHGTGGSALEAVYEPAKEAALQYVGAKYLPGMIEGGAEAVKAGAAKISEKVGEPLVKGTMENFVKPALEWLSKVTPDNIQRIYDRPSEVWKFVGAKPEDVASAGKAFIGVIEDNIQAFHNAYKDIIDSVIKSTDKYGPSFRINLYSPMKEAIESIQKEFGYNVPGRIGDEAETKIFDQFAKQAKTLSNATAEQVYYFQKDLNNAIRRNQGKPIAAALGRLKNVSNRVFTDSIPEIRAANSVYSEGMDMADELGRLLRSETPAQVIQQAKTKNSWLWDRIQRLADENAEARQALDKMLDVNAAQSVTKIIPKFGQSGFYPGIAIGAGVGGAPAMAAATAVAPFISPRIVGLSALAARKITDVTPSILKSAMSGIESVAKAAIPAMSASVGQMVKGEKKAERTPHHIKADYKAGYISKDEAAKELREKHGFN